MRQYIKSYQRFVNENETGDGTTPVSISNASSQSSSATATASVSKSPNANVASIIANNYEDGKSLDSLFNAIKKYIENEVSDIFYTRRIPGVSTESKSRIKIQKNGIGVDLAPSPTEGYASVFYFLKDSETQIRFQLSRDINVEYPLNREVITAATDNYIKCCIALLNLVNSSKDNNPPANQFNKITNDMFIVPMSKYKIEKDFKIINGNKMFK